MFKTIVHWIINMIGYVLVALTIIVIAAPIFLTILFAIKSSGALNVESWNPEQRTHYERVLQITIPDTIEWVSFHEHHAFRDTTIIGELYATSQDYSIIFPSDKYPMDEDLEDPEDGQAVYVLKSLSEKITFRPGSSYKQYKYGHWEIVAEFPLDKNERIHVWFIYFL